MSRPAHPVAFFVHVPKTAGTTVAEAMRLRHGDAFVWAGNVFKDERACRRLLAKLQESRDHPVRVVQGHVPLSLQPLLGLDVVLATFLRDPVDRTASHYYYALRREGSTTPAPISRSSLEDAGIPDNLQTRMLSGMPLDSPPCSRMLDEAIRNLEHEFRVVGVAEHFDESYVLFHLAFGWRPLLISNRQVNPARPRLREIPKDELSALRRHDELDAELYAVAQRWLDGALARGASELRVEIDAYKLARRLWKTEHARKPYRLAPDPDQADEDPAALVRSRAETILIDTALASSTRADVEAAGRILTKVGDLTQRAGDRLEQAQRAMARLEEQNEKLRNAIAVPDEKTGTPSTDGKMGER